MRSDRHGFARPDRGSKVVLWLDHRARVEGNRRARAHHAARDSRRGAHRGCQAPGWPDRRAGRSLAGVSPSDTGARGLAEALNLPLVLVHVIEPAKSALLSRLHVTGLDAGRRSLAEEALDHSWPRSPDDRVRGADRVRGSGRGGGQGHSRSARRSRRDGLARFTAAGSAHGIGDVPVALSLAHAGSRAPPRMPAPVNKSTGTATLHEPVPIDC